MEDWIEVIEVVSVCYAGMAIIPIRLMDCSHVTRAWCACQLWLIAAHAFPPPVNAVSMSE